MTPFGDRAVRFAIPAQAPRRRLQRELAAVPGVVDVVLAEEIGCAYLEGAPTPERDAAMREVIARCAACADDERVATHTIAVVYDGEDLDSVAAAVGRSRDDVARLHASAEYRVAMLGFLPGFAYLEGLPRELRLPRRAPRPRVPAGSVAIAAHYTGIYPYASPGGWHLLGSAPAFVPFDPASGHAALALGDVVRFVPTTPDAGRAARARLASAPPPAGPHLEITRAAGFAVLVDGGRRGRMHEGVPPGGPLVRAGLARANGFAGNEASACAIELAGVLEVTARGGPVLVGDDVLGAVPLAEGERHVAATDGRTRARYLALAGGIDAPVLLGGRGALLAAGIGGPLRRGAKLGAQRGARPSRSSVPEAARPDDPVAIVAGPDADDGVLAWLTASTFCVAPASDRTGTRLEGAPPPLPDGGMARRSTPMTVGAIELTPSGLIVLGPDHPTTGGYPVVGVVRSSSLDALMSRPIGSHVRFRVA